MCERKCANGDEFLTRGFAVFCAGFRRGERKCASGNVRTGTNF